MLTRLVFCVPQEVTLEVRDEEEEGFHMSVNIMDKQEGRSVPSQVNTRRACTPEQLGE